MLDEQLPVVGQAGVNLAQALQVARQRRAEVLLTGEIAAVANPDGNGLRTELFADFNALQVVLDGLSTHRRVGVGEAAEFVRVFLARLILKGVGIDRIEPQAEGLGVLLQGGVVLHRVPGEVGGNRWRGSDELVHRSAVLQLVENVPRLTGSGEAEEARAAGAHAPGRQRNLQRLSPGGQRLRVDFSARQLLPQHLVVALEVGPNSLVLLLDKSVWNPKGLIHESLLGCLQRFAKALFRHGIPKWRLHTRFWLCEERGVRGLTGSRRFNLAWPNRRHQRCRSDAISVFGWRKSAALRFTTGLPKIGTGIIQASGK